MYQIDFLTCTMDDVITRSAVCHPSLFADALIDIAQIHREASNTMRYAAREARQTACSMSVEALDMATRLNEQSFDAASLTFSARIIAFGAACKLQCVPHAIAFDIAKRG